MPLTRLPASNHRAQPWKNGLGVSHTIADFPAAAGFDAVQWQLSWTAFGVDCPFSSLPGLDRQFTVIEGAGVELSSVEESGNARVKSVAPLSPYAFRGDWKTDCRLLGGPVKVFNVMTRRGMFSAQINLVDGAAGLRSSAGETAIAVELPSLEAWILDGAPPAFGRGILVRIRPA